MAASDVNERIPAESLSEEQATMEDDNNSSGVEEPQSDEQRTRRNRASTVFFSVTHGNRNEQETDELQEEGEEEPSCPRKVWNRWWKFYNANEFVILVIIAICLARAYPPLGAQYLYPEVTATWVAVIFIFVLAGLGLKTEELSKAFQRLKFNLFVQAFNFGVVSSVVFGISRGLEAGNVISDGLADGMTISASLPLTINMVLVLTKASGGDEAAAIFNAAFGNMIGVFLSPVLILGYLGVSGDVQLVEVFYKLALRVVLPVLVGQVLQKTSKATVAFVKKHKPKFKQAQQYTLVFIVYTVFCRTFESDAESEVKDIFIMIALVFVILCSLMGLAWVCLKFLFPNDPALRVMGLFGCTHKTVAMGVPLINAIYEGNDLVGLYTLPLLIWHPMQLVIGSYLSPRLAEFVKSEKERLGIKDEADDDEEAADPEAPPPQEDGDKPNSDAEAVHPNVTEADSSASDGEPKDTDQPSADVDENHSER